MLPPPKLSHAGSSAKNVLPAFRSVRRYGHSITAAAKSKRRYRARRSFVTVPLPALLAIFAVTSSAWAAPASQPSDDLLQPEDAFRTTATLVAPNRIEIRYDTAPGYYLYRDRLTYVLEPATAKLGKPNLPPGKVKKDEFFGRQIVYRNKTVVNLPVKSDGATPLTLTADLQGCADLGVCYPPVRRTFTLTPSGR